MSEIIHRYRSLGLVIPGSGREEGASLLPGVSPQTPEMEKEAKNEKENL